MRKQSGFLLRSKKSRPIVEKTTGLLFACIPAPHGRRGGEFCAKKPEQAWNAQCNIPACSDILERDGHIQDAALFCRIKVAARKGYAAEDG